MLKKIFALTILLAIRDEHQRFQGDNNLYHTLHYAQVLR